MKYLIAGLGNIGRQYEATRHNIGFIVLDHLADDHQTKFQPSRLADKAEFKYKGKAIHLIKPSTFMNESGKAVLYWMRHLNIQQENLLIVLDDLALPFGKLRLRKSGSSAGHNGLKSIEAHLNSQEYARLRFGIGNDFSRGQQADFVLSSFAQSEIIDILDHIKKANEMITSFCTIGPDRTMSAFNN